MKTLVYSDFSAGEFGDMSPFNAPEGSWTGTNVVVYRNGRIGPRPGLKHINTSPSPSKAGPLVGLGFSPVGGSGDTPVFFVLEDRVYFFDPVSPTLVAGGFSDLDDPIPNTNANVVLVKDSVRLIGDDAYITVNGSGVYKINCRDQTTTLETADPNGFDIELYRDRMLVATAETRIRYSDAADFTTWPALSFFDVGAAYNILHMVEFRDSLVIFTQWGTWLFSGSPADGTLRRISETLPANYKSVVKLNDELIYVPESRSAPVIFNGSVGDELTLKHLEGWKPAVNTAYGAQSFGNRDAFFLANAGGLGLWRKNGAWSKHEFGGDVGPWVTRYFDDNLLLAYPGDATTDPEFYMLAMNLDRPAFTTDTWARPGDNSTTPLSAEFSLPDYLAPEGKEVRVTGVIVDFYSYDTGSTTPNNITIDVTAMLRENTDGDVTVTKTIYSNDGQFTSTSGQRCRRVFRHPGIGFGSGFRVGFTDLAGVAIERITVEYEEQASPHG